MAVLTSSVTPGSEAFRANRAAHLAALAEVAAAAARRRPAAARRRRRGTSRAARCCRGSGWPGCSTRAARSSRSAPRRRTGMYDGDAPGGGVIAGVGRVEGQEVMVVATTPP